MREALWYDQQRPGLGDELLDEVARGIALLKEYPEAAPSIGGGFRRLLLARFPVGLIYRLDDGDIIVGAVAHTSRKPGYWRRRLFSKGRRR